MKLTIKDNEEVNEIIKSLSEGDIEIINREVEEISKQRNPFFSAIKNHHSDTLTKAACEWLEESDVDYQVKLSEMYFDALVIRVTREYAINIWVNKNKYWEVA